MRASVREPLCGGSEPTYPAAELASQARSDGQVCPSARQAAGSHARQNRLGSTASPTAAMAMRSSSSSAGKSWRASGRALLTRSCKVPDVAAMICRAACSPSLVRATQTRRSRGARQGKERTRVPKTETDPRYAAGIAHGASQFVYLLSQSI